MVGIVLGFYEEIPLWCSYGTRPPRSSLKPDTKQRYNHTRGLNSSEPSRTVCNNITTCIREFPELSRSCVLGSIDRSRS